MTMLVYLHYKVKWFERWSRIRVDVQVNGM